MRSLLWKAAPAAAFLITVLFQVLGPHPIGMADNNDFPKLLGRFGVWVAPEFQRDRFQYFVTDYRIEPDHIWDSGIPSTEVWIARAALWVDQVLFPGRFDMRVPGVLHGVLATLAFWLFLIPLARLSVVRRATFTLLLLLIFADVEYVQFFSTAYMDAGSLVLLMFVFAAAWNAVFEEPRGAWRWPLIYCLSAAAFLGTKPQQAPCAVPLALFALLMARRKQWLIVLPVLTGVALFVMLHIPDGAIAEPEFSVVFAKLLPLSTDPAATLRELGRPESDLAFQGWQAYSPGSPLSDPAYRSQFCRDVSTAKLVAFYLRHPGMAYQILKSDFTAYAPDIPVGNFGTMRRADYPEPVFRAKGLRLWSTIRAQACLWAPWTIPLLYLAALGFSLRRSEFPLVLMASLIGLLAYATGSLGDATETSRHIVVYQEATDMLIVCFSWIGLTSRITS